MNIKLDTKTVQPTKTKLFDLPDNFEVLHNQDFNIVDLNAVYFINFDSMKISDILKIMEQIKVIPVQFVLTSKKYDLIDLMDYLKIVRSVHHEKGYIILI